MYLIMRSTTKYGSRDQQRPEIMCHGDFKSLLIPRLCDEVERSLTPDAELYVRIPGSGEEKISPADNMYGLISAIDRGCTHVIVDVPGGYSSYRVHFAIEEI